MALAPGVELRAVTNADQAVISHLPVTTSPGARDLALAVEWAHVSIGGTETVKFADAFAKLLPKSILARTWLADQLEHPDKSHD